MFGERIFFQITFSPWWFFSCTDFSEWTNKLKRMKKLTFSVIIHSSRELLWQTLWDDATYRDWTAVFTPGSHAVSDWEEGSKILFLSPGGDGMTSRIARLVPNEFMSFEHLGEVINGKEDFTKGWSGAFENYTLRETAGGTELLVELDMSEEHEEYMAGIFPKALARVKELAEMKMRKINIDTLRQAAHEERPGTITVQATLRAPLEKVWHSWTRPEHIVHWNFASEDWCSPRAENDLRPGGSFSWRMESKDGKMGFDFNGTYTVVAENERLEYTLEDGRRVVVHFSPVDGSTCVTETFEPESIHSLEMQQAGWQAILDNFKRYTEGS